jgi:hypothetical protein
MESLARRYRHDDSDLDLGLGQVKPGARRRPLPEDRAVRYLRRNPVPDVHETKRRVNSNQCLEEIPTDNLWHDDGWRRRRGRQGCGTRCGDVWPRITRAGDQRQEHHRHPGSQTAHHFTYIAARWPVPDLGIHRTEPFAKGASYRWPCLRPSRHVGQARVRDRVGMSPEKGPRLELVLEHIDHAGAILDGLEHSACCLK